MQQMCEREPPTHSTILIVALRWRQLTIRREMKTKNNNKKSGTQKLK